MSEAVFGDEGLRAEAIRDHLNELLAGYACRPWVVSGIVASIPSFSI
jgi:hypothetical protein